MLGLSAALHVNKTPMQRSRDHTAGQKEPPAARDSRRGLSLTTEESFLTAVHGHCQYFFSTSSTALVVPSGRTIQSPRHCESVGRNGFPSAAATGAYCPLSLHSL